MRLEYFKYSYKLGECTTSNLYFRPASFDGLEADFNLGFDTSKPHVFNVRVIYTPILNDLEVCTVTVETIFEIEDVDRWPLKVNEATELVKEAIKIMIAVLKTNVLDANDLSEALPYLCLPTEEEIENRLKIYLSGISLS